MGTGGWIRHGVLVLVGLGLGAVSAMVEFGFLLIAGMVLLPTLAWPRARGWAGRRVHGAGRWLAGLERRRVARFLRGENADSFDSRRAVRYLAVRWLVGALGGLVLLLLALGLVTAGTLLTAWLFEGRWSLVEDGGGVDTGTVLVVALPGLVMLYLNVMGIAGVADLDRRIARHFLGPSPRERLERRIAELAISRAEVVAAVNDERRRIERDLHDGVQQRLVALGMLLGRARRTRDQSRASDLLRQAHDESQQALNDLRGVAWRVYPTALDQLGLRDVLADIADRAGIPVRLHYELTERPPAPVETVAYFVVSEAVSNAVKHSGAGLIVVRVHRAPGGVLVEVEDDGKGGADPAGRGLSGLAGRVAATDGSFEVRSPDGGPTAVRADLPCG